MPDARVIIEGRLATDPRFNTTQNGNPVANIRVLAGRSRKTDSGWETLSTTAYDCSFWGAHHDLVAALGAGKGDIVVVTGTIGSVESYHGQNGESLSAKVNATGLQVYPKRDQQQGGYQTPQQGYGQQQGYQQPPANDPWGAPQGGNPPF